MFIGCDRKVECSLDVMGGGYSLDVTGGGLIVECQRCCCVM